MKIHTYKPELKTYFTELNRAWVEKYFKLEPIDIEQLYHPETYVLAKGGEIFFLEHEGQIVGTVALAPMPDGEYEMIKMAVDERFQGRGFGQILCKAVIAEAKKRNLQKIILYSNSQLKAAISIYEKLGFKHLPPDSHEYTRADVKMELDLSEVEVDDTISSAII